MNSRRRFLFCLGLVALVLLFTSASPSSGQEEQTKAAVPAHGFQVLGHLLNHFQLSPLPDVAALEQTNPGEMWIIALGELKLKELNAHLAGGLEGFLKQGGALFIASAAPDRDQLRRWKLQIPGGRVLQRPESAYRGLVECPYVVEGLGSGHPLFQGLRRGIATNRPSSLRTLDADLLVLADFSADCTTSTPPIFAEAGPLHFLCGSPHDAPPAGRMAVMSGEGVFINSMLISLESDNFDFAMNAIKWFRQGPAGNRKYVLLLEDGVAVTKFALPLQVKMPRVPPEAMLLIFNNMLAEMDKENAFNRILLDVLGHRRAYQVVWITLAVLLALLLLRRFFSARFRLETWVPLVVGRHAAPPPLPIEWQRQLALEKLDNYWEPAQVLVRQFFLDHAGRMPPFWEEFDQADFPAMEARGGWWARRQLTRRARELWRLAYTPPARRLSRRRFIAMLRVAADLKAAVLSGRLLIK